MNNWKIPKVLEDEIRKRDRKCVYCGDHFSDIIRPTWEHIINDQNIINIQNIALCCRRCNSSKGQKQLNEWIEMSYCKIKGISYKSVAKVIKDALDDKK